MFVKNTSEASSSSRAPIRWMVSTVRMALGIALLWVHASSAQVDIPEGYEIVEFSIDQRKTGPPAINDCGEIVYVKDRFEDSRVYLYDSGKISRLTDYDDGRGVGEPRINENGLVVWYRAMRRQPGSGEIVVFEDGERTVIAPGSRPVLNDLGHMAWQVFRQITCNYEQGITLFDGQTITPITDDGFNNQSISMNNLDWVTWGRGDHCVNPWVGNIQLHMDDETVTLPSKDTQSQVPAVNDRGQVAWFMGGIEIWEDGVTTLLTDWGGNPEINNHGDIFFYRWHDDLDTTDAWMYRNRDGEGRFHRLTEDSLEDTIGDINDWGEAAWRFRQGLGNWAGGVRYLRRIRTGDADFDGVIDLGDHARFFDCMTGPGRVDRLCDCRFLDLDHDGDVDLADFTKLQDAMARD